MILVLIYIFLLFNFLYGEFVSAQIDFYKALLFNNYNKFQNTQKQQVSPSNHLQQPLQAYLMNPAQLTQVSIASVTSKVSSKKELYQFLVMDCQAYLPPIQSTNVYYFKAIMRGDKDVSLHSAIYLIWQYVKRDKIMIAAVPQIEGLTVEDILAFGKSKASVLKHLPDERDWVHIDRKWMCDMVYTLEKAAFTAFITLAMKSRRDKLDDSRSLLVEMRPEFAQALGASLNYSVQPGKSANLLKSSSKRKRTKEEIKEVELEEQDLKKGRHEFLQGVRRLKEEKAEMEQTLDQISRQSLQSAMVGGQAMLGPQNQPFNI